MAKLYCPVPGCPEGNFRRQTDVNTHLCDHHHIDLKRQYGGNMKALRETQQQQFSTWLQINGYPNASLFADVPSNQPGSQDTDENNHETNQKSSGGDSDNDTASSRERNEADAHVDTTDKLENLLLMIETTDESGLDVGTNHGSNNHTIVCEDGTFWYADQSPIYEEDDEE